MSMGMGSGTIEIKLPKKVLSYIKFGAVAVAAAVLLANSVYTVNEQERAVITQFGRYVDTAGAGLQFKIPFMQNVQKVNMTTRGLELGYRTTNGVETSVESESFMITKDFNFVNVDFYVEWRVDDPFKYLYNAQKPEELLKNILQSEARSVVSGYVVDDVLTTGKTAIQNAVRENVTKKIAEYDIGIAVMNVSIQDAEPPTAEVASAFKNVENAKQNMDTEINVANTYANQIIPQARADANKLVQEAEAVKEARINEAHGQTARFNAIFIEYSENKDVTKTRMYLEAMESILPDLKVIVDSGDMTKIMDVTKNTNTDNTVRNAAVTGGEEAYDYEN